MKMKESKYKKDINRVEITGEIRNLPEFCRYVPNPLVSFDLITYRQRKSEEDEYKFDEQKIVLFDDENFLLEAKEGERYKFFGELQSRNFNRTLEDIDELYVLAVQNYNEIMEHLPCEVQPEGRKKEVVDWRKLLELKLIPKAPEDSMYNDEMFKEKDREKCFIYRLDESGELTKETQHVTYEILVSSYEKLEEPLDNLRGDVNKVTIAGRITKNPFFNMLGTGNKIPFVNFNIGTKSEIFPTHMFFNNAIAWGKNAENIFQNLHEGDYVKIKGRLQTRKYTKELIKRWKTAGGNKKKKVIPIELLTREVSISIVEKLFKK